MGRRITVEISDADAALIEEFLAASGDSEHTERGALTFEKLTKMLLEDCALVVRRPGSWEGANMRQVLGGHGYCS